MDSKVSSLLFIAILFLLSSTSTAFNITKILAQYPEFASFNDLLAQSGLAQEINGRETITVLALDNGSIDGLSGRPVDIAKRILSAHVILDYYDQIKLSKLQKASTIVTTLFQASGIADDRQGFLNVSKTAEGIKFGSAMKGAPLVASLVKSVYAQPYNISVLQVSEPIEAPGIENMTPPPPPAAVPKKAPAPAPAAKTPSKAPAPSKVEPSPPTESPTEGPVAPDVPAASPLADAPLADEVPAKAASSQMHVGGAVVVVGLLACMVGF
ncbi:FASCICLIN-LIKE ARABINOGALACTAN PROTEIN 3 [Salix purpurea]|uniref:FASCICLIN-LIKE ARABINOGALACTAN PROTEIN 3 n=1 Tax=Salix purpurea TaxID=77065 RepID=A0A9Q0ULF0_SALPP|nr:FASCICLIN-LIKE ARABINOGALACTAN PROTEIN 3 [Salix purpurea]